MHGRRVYTPAMPSLPAERSTSTYLVALLIVGTLLATPAAAIVCQKKKSGVLRMAATACKRNEVPFEGALGPIGPPGPAGSDGQLRIYGDGSAGARTIAEQEHLEDVNLQYTDFTVPAGATVVVPSGTVIRCTGTFTNNGTVLLGYGGLGARCVQSDASSIPAFRGADPGVAFAAASNGELGDNSNTTRYGASGGEPLDEDHARRTLKPGAHAGGGGGCGTTYGGGGGPGGGAITILAAVAIVNNGLISANPRTIQPTGGGGGAGGIVILASRGSVTNNGTLKAEGADGGEAHDASAGSFPGGGAGGGGGGGIVHLLAPVINAAGAVSVAGGLPGVGAAPGSVTTTYRMGGGGGGACGGRGGRGGDVSGNDPIAALPGEAGRFLQSVLDPTALF